MSAAVSIDSLYENLRQQGVEVLQCPTKEVAAIAEPEGYLCLNPGQIETTAQEREILIHEEGHFATGTFYQYDSPYTVREHQENVASRYGFKRYFPLEKLLGAIEDGDLEPWQMAERFGLPEGYIVEMLDYYTQSQGVDFEAERAKWRRAVELADDPLTEATRVRLEACMVPPDTWELTETEAQGHLEDVEHLLQLAEEKVQKK